MPRGIPNSPRFGSAAWPMESVNFLRANWGKMSTRQIAEALGKERNAVIGKAHRLGLANLGNPVGGGTRETAIRKPYKRRDDYSPSALKAAAARQDAAFSARLTSAQQAKQAAATGGRSLSARVAGSITSAAKRAKAAAGTATRNAQQRNAIVFASHAEKPRATTVSPFVAAPITPKPAEKDDGRRGVPFAGLSGRGCKWAVTPDNVRADQHRFCNAPSAPEQPYCPQHCEAARRDVYEAALGALKDTPLADAAMKRDGVKKAEGDGGTVLKRPGKPLTNEEAEALSDELAKVPGVTSVKVVRVTTSVVPPEGRASSPDAPPPKDVAGSLASIKAAMHAPAR